MGYWICPVCGAHLDPGERCDCMDKKESPDCFPAQDFQIEKSIKNTFFHYNSEGEGLQMEFDPLEDFKGYGAGHERELQKLPECSECKEPIQTEYCYEMHGGFMCEDCLKSRKKETFLIVQEALENGC